MWRRALVLLLVVLASAGCALVPPRKLPMDRENYLDAVSTSWKEQLLTNLVNLRYGDTLTTLEMTSINTTYALDSNFYANYPLLWHPLHSTYPQSSWTDAFRNALTLGGTVTYQDHPSIAYSPIRGEALAKTMIEPIPPSKLVKSLQTGWLADYIFPCCVKAINDLRNRSSSGNIKGDPKFFKFVELCQYLKKYGVIRIAIKEQVDPKVTKVPEKYEVTLHMTGPGKDKIVSGEEPAMKAGNRPKKGKETGEATPEKDNGTKDSAISDGTKDSAVGELVLDNKRAEEMDKNPGDYLTDEDQNDNEKIKDKIKRFKDLLWSNHPPPVKPTCGRYEVYKIIDGNQNPPQSYADCEKIVMQTRSIYETLNMLAMFIDVPLEDRPANGNENRASPNTLVGKPLNGQEVKHQKMFIIYSDKNRPSDAFVKVKHGDYWFYIKNTDYGTKDMFTSTQVILSMFETGSTQGTPVLTLPVQ